MGEAPAKLARVNTGALEGLAARINAEHRACEAAAGKAVAHAMEAGRMLKEAKAGVAHGEWLPWLENNFEGTARTAQVYMQLHDRRDELANTQHASHLSIRGALKELSAPKEGSPEKPAQAGEDEGLTDEQVVELVRDWMEMAGPTDLSDVEQAALERRLAEVGGRERDLLSEIHFEHIMMYGLQVAQDGFIIGEHDGKGVVEWRDETKEKLFYRCPLPEPGTTKLPESERLRVKRGAKVYSVLKFQVWRLLSDWFTEVLIAEVDDLEKVEQRIMHNADWKRAEPAGEYLRDKLLHEGVDEDRKLDMKKWALRHQVMDLRELMNQVYTIERVWCAIEARRLEDGLMGDTA